MAKRILCFGDSNVWGTNPSDGKRHPDSVRWTGVLLEHLGKGHAVIEEGLPGRTTCHDDPIEGPSKNGKLYLEPCLASHSPLDLVIVLLGACDMKKRFSLTARDIAAGMEKVIQTIQNSKAGPEESAPDIMLLTPIAFGPKIAENPRYEKVDAVHKHVATYYEELAKKYECALLDTSKYVSASPIDSIHLDAEGHHKLGTAIAAMATILLT